MRCFHSLVIMAVVAAMPVAAQAKKVSKAELAAIAATPEQIANTVKVTDDSLDLAARIDTSPFYGPKQGLLRVATSDKYFRAFIDKKTGETELQLVVWVSHGRDWQFWDRATAEGPDGPVALSGHSLDSDVSCTSYGCTKTESVAIDVDESLLRWVASTARAGVEGAWKLKLNGRYVDGVPIMVLRTEAAGLLIALDRLRQKYPLQTSAQNR